MNRILGELVEKLRQAHGDHLVSVVLYGSAASEDVKDAYSDYNVLCVLRQVTPGELMRSEPVFRWWRDLKNPSPLLLSEQEVVRSADAFPIEFHDIKERHVVLHGADVVSGLTVERHYYRALVEHELRAKLLRLRQKAAGILSEKDLLLRLMVESVSTFCVLIRHALWLAGDSPQFAKRAVIAAAGARWNLDGTPFEQLLDLREGKLKPRGLDAVGLFSQYLQQVQNVIAVVDQMEEHGGER